ncbi:hypothetical protein SAY86_001675 [Trapa natans]|uniref:Alpha-(1,6)-fucosyltransferase n=1 Tax=Trapa natans TaxID=22666 RepID=A0AAN7LQC3_TRANT|nr:hypothetical protein SAY86_001675 [Trapa natans]
MEKPPPNLKTMERVVSHRALQMGNSFSCQICVLGFLSGVCIASVFMAALTSFGAFEFRGDSLSMGIIQRNSSSNIIKTERWIPGYSNGVDDEEEDTVALLYSAWSSVLGAGEPSDAVDKFLRSNGSNQWMLPKAPHLEDCKLMSELNKRLDDRQGEETFPRWTSWKGALDTRQTPSTDDQIKRLRHREASSGSYPPWIMGSDEENYPLTRKVQRDLWIHQHPMNCSDPNVRFLVADWERDPGFGIGAQFAGMCGLLAIAIREKRVLVTNYYNRADHEGCKGSSRSSWSCYFFPETSQECRAQAFELMKHGEVWAKGIVTAKQNYTSKEIWAGRIPRQWGKPWSYLQPTTEINGSLIAYHRKMDRRWWRAQALRYLMRFQTVYTCSLMNEARHRAFGKEAAKHVLSSPGRGWPQSRAPGKGKSDMEEFVWSSHRAWIPRPLLSVHVRMGDKACEMKVVEFQEYMSLADRIRRRFPHLNSIWLSTEMQEVIDKSKLYPQWKFYYTNVTRQAGSMLMASYEASLGRETSTNYPLVNFLMASDADFFVGALGSTWCFLIDGMRNTGGKVMSGYLSVNKDRFW